MITAVSMIKNAADVIETMVRGNALVADNFVIINNNSTDNTLDIITNLKKEGFEIEVLSDDNTLPYQQARVSEGIRYALDHYAPDYILPVDDDEIICSGSDDISAESLKGHIESLDQNDLYYMNWRNYIPTDEDDTAVVSVAARQKYCLDDEPEMTKKILIPTTIAKDDSFKIGWGGHFAECNRIKHHVELKEVRLAHYPIRSSVQIASKAIVGWMNILAMPDREKSLDIHWQVMYKAIKEYGLPTNDTMMTLANLYREKPNDTEHLNVIYNPISIPDTVFGLKYTTGSEVNLLKNICENIEKLASEYADLLRKESD